MPFFCTGASTNNSLCIYPHSHAKIPHLLSLDSTTDSSPQHDTSEEVSHSDANIPLHIFTGPRHGFVLTADGAIYGFTASDVPEALALNPNASTKNSHTPLTSRLAKKSSLINLKVEAREFFDRVRVKEIACGEDFSVLLSQNNELYCFGSNKYGNLGLAHDVDIHIPVKNSHAAFVADAGDGASARAITHISCGNHHTCIVLDHVDLFCFGNNKHFQCGIVGDSVNRAQNITEPRHVLSFYSSDDVSNYEEKKERIVHIASGREHNVVVTENNTIWTWGGNSMGQCGLAHERPVTSPQRMQFPQNPQTGEPHRIKLVDCAEYLTVFVTESDDIYVCGNFLEKHYGTPTRLEFDSEKHTVDQLSVGDGFFFFSTDANTSLWVCGKNDAFQLGLGNQISKQKPTRMKHDFLASSAYSHLACGNNFAIFSTFTKQYEIESHDDLKDQLMAQAHRRTGYLYDLELVVSGKQFCVCRDLVERRYPLAVQLDRSTDILSAEAFSLIIDYIYTDDVRVPPGKENYELVLLELYAFVASHPSAQSNSRLENLLLRRIADTVSETTVVHLLRKLDDIMKAASSQGGRGPKRESFVASNGSSEERLSHLRVFRQHLLAFLKKVMDENRLGDVPNFKALPVEVLHEILLHGASYTLLTDENLQQVKSTYIDDLRALCIDARMGNTRLVLDKSGRHALRVHRSIIAARCPRLRDILNDHFQRNNDVIVFIEDYLDDESMIHVFPEFVEFLYTGEIVISPKNAMPMIRIWEAMGMPMNHVVSLRCQEMSVNTLTLDNVLPLYRSLLSRRKAQDRPGSQALGMLEQECKKLCLRHWRDLHSRLGADMLQYFVDPRVYFALNCEYLGVKPIERR